MYPAKNTAITVLIVRRIITNFIKLSKNLYLPIIKIKTQENVMVVAHIVILDESPNNSIAKPAVTMVTAV